jgi:hypothetical protein
VTHIHTYVSQAKLQDGCFYADVYAMLYDEFETHGLTVEKLALLSKNTRLVASQAAMRGPPGQVADHRIFSAFIKMVFALLQHETSIKLYNILFTMFVLNSTLNLVLVPKAENSADSATERALMWVCRSALVANKRDPRQRVKDLILYFLGRSVRRDAIRALLRDKWVPHYTAIRDILLFSSSAVAIIDWVIKTVIDVCPADEARNRSKAIANVKRKRRMKANLHWPSKYLQGAPGNYYIDRGRSMIWCYHLPINFGAADLAVLQHVIENYPKNVRDIIAMFDVV